MIIYHFTETNNYFEAYYFISEKRNNSIWLIWNMDGDWRYNFSEMESNLRDFKNRSGEEPPQQVNKLPLGVILELPPTIIAKIRMELEQ